MLCCVKVDGNTGLMELCHNHHPLHYAAGVTPPRSCALVGLSLTSKAIYIALVTGEGSAVCVREMKYFSLLELCMFFITELYMS